jgi:hypothetical protein
MQDKLSNIYYHKKSLEDVHKERLNRDRQWQEEQNWMDSGGDMRTASNNTYRCKICGKRLSLYNDGILCFSCQDKKGKKALGIEVLEPLKQKIFSR